MKEEVEALLFSAGRKMEVEELSKLCKSSSGEITKSLRKLKKDYEERNSPLMVIQEGTSWKLTVSEKYLPLVQKIVTETELSKTIMETLAVIAWKHPALQSDVIKIRTNKAYEHLKELEEIGYITRAREGRSKKIRLTQKFFDYFDLPKEELGKKFENFNEIAQVIEAKEAEIEKIKAEAKESKKEKSSQDNPEVDLIDKEGHKQKLEVVDETKIKPTQEELDNLKSIPDKEMLGKLEVIDEKSSAPEDNATETEDEQPETEEEPEPIETEPEEEESNDEKEKPKRYGKGIKLPKEQQGLVDKRVEEIMDPSKEEPEKTETPEKEEEPKAAKNKKGKNKEESSNDEPVDLLEASSKKNKP